MSTKRLHSMNDRLEPRDARRGGLDHGPGIRSATETLVEFLTTRVRLLSLEQVTELCFRHAKEPLVIARKHLHRMEKKGLVKLLRVMTVRDIHLERPLLDWHPGNGLPDFGHLSWLAEKRLAAPLASTLVVHATKASQEKTLGPLGTRPPRSQEITHDLLVASVFQALLKTAPELARSWTPEDALLQELVAEQGHFSEATIPDAVVGDGSEKIAIDVVGRYSPKKLAAIHDAYNDKRYQLW